MQYYVEGKIFNEKEKAVEYEAQIKKKAEEKQKKLAEQKQRKDKISEVAKYYDDLVEQYNRDYPEDKINCVDEKFDDLKIQLGDFFGPLILKSF